MSISQNTESSQKKHIMARLVVNPGSPSAWEIQLKPGDNFVGRGFANDFKIPDPSVSGSHCQIVVTDKSAVIKDLGSTNGTYVNRAPVRESVLQTGQTVHLGSVEMVYYSDAAGGATATQPPQPVRVTAVPARAAAVSAAPARVAVAVPAAARSTIQVPPPRAAQPAAVAAPPVAVPPPVAAPVAGAPSVAHAHCKHHPKTLGRFVCPQCHNYFCELCVTSRTVGGAARKFCRQCGVECTPAHMQVTRPSAPKGFLRRLPGAFVYPFRGSGLMVLIVSTLVFAALGFLGFGFSVLIWIVAVGYLFSYMQNIIHATANEEAEMPDLPGFDDVLGACFRLVGCVVLSFGIAIGLAIYAFTQEEPTAAIAIIPAVLFGCLYFPMAFLAVAMKDSVMAANPLVVIPAIFKVPLEYLLTVILMGGIFGIRSVGELVLALVVGDAFSTKDMSMLFISAGLRMSWSFLEIYLLAVSMRILGLLYLTKKDRLGWYSN